MLRSVAAAHAAETVQRPHVYHFEPTILAVAFNHGIGVAKVGPVLRKGASVDFKIHFPYMDVKPSWKVSIDEKTRTLTVTVDGTSPNRIHALMAIGPTELSIPVERPAQINATYKLYVRNIHEKIVKKTTFKNFLP